MKTFIFLLVLLTAHIASAQSVVINEVYGAGGNAGALFTHDYIELFNNGSTPVDLGGWSVQYASATSTGTWQVTLLSGVIEPGRTLLIQEAGGVNGSPLPIADVTGTLSMAATAGKVALVQSVTQLSGACPVSALVIDRVGYGGSANCFEGAAPAPAPSAILSTQRQTAGVDTNSNAADFQSATPTPTNSLPRSQMITFAAIGSHAYGDVDFTVIASASSGLPVVITSADPLVAEVSGMTVTIRGAGDVELTASQAGDGTFAPATAVQTLHVEKAVLNVTAASISRIAGVANPPFQIQYSGFVGIDTESLLDVPPVASCAANLTSPPGNYAITIVGGSDNNYQFIYSPGTLTVNPSAAASSVRVLTPVDGATDVFVSPTIQCVRVNDASTYVLQLSVDPSFTNFIELQGSRVFRVSGLSYNTTYYARVRTNLPGEFGIVTRFTTGAPAQFAMLQSPTSNSTGVGLSTMLKFAEVPGAAIYTYELSASSSFTSLVAVQSGASRQGVTGLTAGTTYFVRVKTDLSPSWGPVRSFHTAPMAELCYLRYPAERFTQISWLPELVLNDVGAPAYVVQLSEVENFTSFSEFAPTGVRFTLTDPLKFRTRYYSRVRPVTEPDNWGPVRSFATSHPADYSSLRTPADGSEGVATRARLVLLLVPGATSYELSLSTNEDFADEVRYDASGRTRLLDLQAFTTYYARVRTNLSEEWGTACRFTTAGVGKSTASSREASDYANASSDQPAGGLAMEEGVTESNDSEPASVQAFPNPFSESMTLCLGQAAFVKVSDLNGRVIFNGRVNAHECCELGEGWSVGVYVATVVTATSSRTIRLCKVHGP